MPGGDKHFKSGIAEARCIIVALQLGWEITKPLSDIHPYDFVIRRNTTEGWKSVQVKAVYIDASGNGGPRRVVSVRRGRTSGKSINRVNKLYTDGDFDFLLAVDMEDVWLIPWHEIRHFRSVVCPPQFPNYKIIVPRIL